MCILIVIIATYVHVVHTVKSLFGNSHFTLFTINYLVNASIVCTVVLVFFATSAARGGT